MLPVHSPASRTGTIASPIRFSGNRTSGSNPAQGPSVGGGPLGATGSNPGQGPSAGGGPPGAAQYSSRWPTRSPTRLSRSDAFASPPAAAQSVSSTSVPRDAQPNPIYVEIETEPTPRGNESAPLLPGVELRSNLPGSWHLRKSGSRSSSRSASPSKSYTGTDDGASHSRRAPRSAKVERRVASYWVLGLTVVSLLSASALVMTLINRGYVGGLSGYRRTTGTSGGPRGIQTDEPLPGDPNFKVRIVFRPTDRRSPQSTSGPSMVGRLTFTPTAVPRVPSTTIPKEPMLTGEGEAPPLPEPAPPAGGWLDYDPIDRGSQTTRSTNESAANTTSGEASDGALASHAPTGGESAAATASDDASDGTLASDASTGAETSDAPAPVARYLGAEWHGAKATDGLGDDSGGTDGALERRSAAGSAAPIELGSWDDRK